MPDTDSKSSTETDEPAELDDDVICSAGDAQCHVSGEAYGLG
jgi:hypothetical protein